MSDKPMPWNDERVIAEAEAIRFEQLETEIAARGRGGRMNTGDVVLITGEAWRTRQGSIVRLYESTYTKPKKALLLGKSKRFTGSITYNGYDDPGQLHIKDTHDVWMVMEIVNGNRYRQPISVLEAQIQEQPNE